MRAPGIVQGIISACENEMMRDYSEIIAGSGGCHTTFFVVSDQKHTIPPFPSCPSCAFSLHLWPVHLLHACFNAVVLRIACENTSCKPPISPSGPFCTHTLCYPTLATFIARQRQRLNSGAVLSRAVALHCRCCNPIMLTS